LLSKESGRGQKIYFLPPASCLLQEQRWSLSSVNNMSQEPEFPFDRARRVTPEENQKFRDAIQLRLVFFAAKFHL
jgi:hypothetical protein